MQQTISTNFFKKTKKYLKFSAFISLSALMAACSGSSTTSSTTTSSEVTDDQAENIIENIPQTLATFALALDQAEESENNLSADEIDGEISPAVTTVICSVSGSMSIDDSGDIAITFDECDNTLFYGDGSLTYTQSNQRVTYNDLILKFGTGADEVTQTMDGYIDVDTDSAEVDYTMTTTEDGVTETFTMAADWEIDTTAGTLSGTMSITITNDSDDTQTSVSCTFEDLDYTDASCSDINSACDLGATCS